MIDLPFPHKALWPNGRSHFMTKAREVKKHRQWAHDATLATFPRCFVPPERLQWLVTVYPKPKTNKKGIDPDNAAAAMKAYCDGIAQALGLDDSRFEALRVQFGEKVPNGKVVFTLMEGL